jgi:hypothetical protein
LSGWNTGRATDTEAVRIQNREVPRMRIEAYIHRLHIDHEMAKGVQIGHHSRKVSCQKNPGSGEFGQLLPCS